MERFQSGAAPPETLDVPEFEVASSFVLPGSHSSYNSGATLSAGNLDSSETPEPEIPAELVGHPRYRIVKRLGSGGMGTVYLAEHRLMDRSVALKVIRRDLLGNEALVERFRREVRAAARLGLHPNIVAAYDAEQAADSHFLVMEFVEGVDLAHLVKRQGPLPCALACQAVKQAAEGLEHAFQRGMVHRDIKPQNLMCTPDGQVKILDFGLARFASEALPELVPADERETEPGAGETSRDRGARLRSPTCSWERPITSLRSRPPLRARPTSAPTSTVWGARSIIFSPAIRHSPTGPSSKKSRPTTGERQRR